MEFLIVLYVLWAAYNIAWEFLFFWRRRKHSTWARKVVDARPHQAGKQKAG